VLTLMQAPQQIAATITSAISSPIVIMLVINLFLLVVGMIMETLAAILILTPIFLPIITQIGVNPIHFGVIMVVNLAIGFVTPPVGMNLYVASSMSGIPVMRIAKHALPFIVAFFIALMIITFVPQISLLLIS
jgi:C4-dicarboxylate transporter DctM subunit